MDKVENSAYTLDVSDTPKQKFQVGDVVVVYWRQDSMWNGIGQIVDKQGRRFIINYQKDLPLGGFNEKSLRLATDAEALAWRLTR